MADVLIARQGDALDGLIWRERGLGAADLPAVLEANPGLAALGALVAVSYEKGLAWADRFTQFAVGVIVSYFVTRVVGALWALDPFVLQGVSFSIGMVAFRAAPRFISGAAEAIGTLPGAVRDLLPLKRKDGK